ncbi:uncharacterized protein LOC117791571 [Drosophila innubila]|uniref:uncharacterized protein LOC117791571 n=1 Tax=Drosophila innubila TaxID=198719 RepID=UPI00148D0F2C|nr:uncharacterized protein LOC117791571 [Drosophila innubila]
MKNCTIEFLLWINHLQSLEFGLLGITLIMGGVYLPTGNAYMQVQLVCNCSLTMRKLFIVSGGTMILTGAMTAFWYRRHMEIIYMIYIVLIVLSIVFTISLTICITNNCDSKTAIEKIEKLWLNTEYDDNTFFKMQQYLECCGKTGESDYVEKEPFPVCHKDFDNENTKFTVGCVKAAERFYDQKALVAELIACLVVIIELKGLGLAAVLYRTRKRVAALSIQHTVTYTQ